jgi:hypothetical protein
VRALEASMQWLRASKMTATGTPTDDELREVDIDSEKDRCRSKDEGALPDALE